MVALGGRRRPRTKDTPMKNLNWIIVPLALLTLAPVTVSAAQAVAKTKDAVVKDAKIVGTKTKEGLSKTGEVITDAWITTRIHERFVGEDLLKGSDISVDTAQHVVTLKGTVVGSAGRARAAHVAKNTEGVHRVVNHLTIGPKHTN
jgi:osmotically-inducible protein OsmY